MAGTKNVVRSNVVSQVPYFITFSYDNTSTKPVISLSEHWRYYNNMSMEIPLYGATNITASFNGKNVNWNYKKIVLEGTVTQFDKNLPVFTSNDETKFEIGSYYQSKKSGEIILVEKIDTSKHTVVMRRQMFNTALTYFHKGDEFFQMNTIEIIPPNVTTAMAGVYTLTFSGTPKAGNVITIAGVATELDSTSAASLQAVINAIKAKTFEDYTVESSGTNVLKFTEKSGKFGTGEPAIVIDSLTLKADVDVTAAGASVGYESGVGTIWANPLMGPSSTGYYTS